MRLNIKIVAVLLLTSAPSTSAQYQYPVTKTVDTTAMRNFFWHKWQQNGVLYYGKPGIRSFN